MRLQLIARFSCVLGLLGLLGLLVPCGSALADSASGRWTGEVEARLNYYYERSTRVIVPTAAISAVAPNDVRVGASYLVDVISSASIAQTGGGEDAVFTELRHGVGVGVGKPFSLGDSELDLFAHLTYSTENDYTSFLYGADAKLTWNDRQSSLSLGVSRVDDTIYDNTDPSFEEPLDGLSLRMDVQQIVSKVVTLGLGYQVAHLSGFLSNPYRSALIGPLPAPEEHPSDRLRQQGIVHLGLFIPASDTALHFYYRAYIDSWDVAALTPEVRVYQELGPDLIGRLRYRYYTQTHAYFFRARYEPGYEGYVSADPKMSEFHSHQMGGKLEYRLSFFGGTVFDFARDAWIDLSFDYQINTSTFGDEVIATAGGRLPF